MSITTETFNLNRMPLNTLRILCISPAFPPWADSESYCGGKMVKALADAGHDLAVLCDPLPPRGMADSSSYWKELETVTHCINVPPTWKTGIREMCSWVYYGFLFRTPQKGLWVKNYVEHAKKLHREKPFDLVYSRSLPIYAHIAGYWCSRSLGVPWIVNINDPWDWFLIPEYKSRHVPAWYASVSRYWLRMTFRHADLITHPTLELQRFHMQLATIRNESVVIPHIGCTVNTADTVTSKFYIVHTGKLRGGNYSLGRSTAGFLAGLATFLKAYPPAKNVTRVVFVGTEDPATSDMVKRLGLEDLVEWVGRVSYGESLKYIASASVCVLVEHMMTKGIYFPSKLADYIAARKPILALSPAHGFIADLAGKGGIKRVEADDVREIASAIGVFFMNFLEGRLAENSPSDTLARHVSPDDVAEKFLQAAKSVCCKAAGLTRSK